MGLIGVRIRIAIKEKLVPEFELIKDKEEKKKRAVEPVKKVEEVELSKDVKVEVVKVEGTE
ncbi:30S ribosomal protein S3, partial [Nitrosopumilus sp.]|nr:30S ribosomal protein S3 [Nitrosopumilus sp.]